VQRPASGRVTLCSMNRSTFSFRSSKTRFSSSRRAEKLYPTK